MTNTFFQPWRLLRRRRFAPLFAAQFLGAFNDNLLKQALIITLAFQANATAASDAAIAAASGLYILPFFLLSALSGDLSDRFDKAILFTRLKLLEIALMSIAFVGFWMGSIPVLLGALFLMGAQSSFFAPLKFGLLTENLESSQLTAGTALVGGSTYVAILAGFSVGGGLAALPSGGVLAACAGVAAAVFGWVAALAIRRGAAADAGREPDLVLPRGVYRLVREILHDAPLRRLAFGIMWFWSFGTFMLIMVPIFVRDAIGGDEIHATALAVLFAIGIAFGALLANVVNRGEPVLAAAFPGAAGVIVLPAVAALMAAAWPVAGAVFSSPQGLAVVAAVVMVAVTGGMFVVPLQTQLQLLAPDNRRGRVFGALNAINAIGSATTSVVAMILLARGVPVIAAFIGAAIANAAIGCLVLPHLWRRRGHAIAGDA